MLTDELLMSHSPHGAVAFTTAALLFGYGCSAEATSPTLDRHCVVEVTSGAAGAPIAPIEFEIPAAYATTPTMSLQRCDVAPAAAPLAVQRISMQRGVFLPVASYRPHEVRRYRLLLGGTPLPARVRCVDNGRQLELRVGRRLALRYHHAIAPAPTDIDPVYARSGFIDPVLTPTGRVVTDGFPPEHAHQHGIFFAWVNTLYQDKPIDFWNQKKRQGTVEHATLDDVQNGPVFGSFQATLLHIATQADQRSSVLTEQWTVRLYATEDHFLFDVVSVQRAVSEPLQVSEYHYGGFGIRGHRRWSESASATAPDPEHPGGVHLLTSEGLSRPAGNHTRPNWVSMWGTSDDGQLGGMTVMQHPENFRFPQPVRLHPECRTSASRRWSLAIFGLRPRTPTRRVIVSWSTTEPAITKKVMRSGMLLRVPPPPSKSSAQRPQQPIDQRLNLRERLVRPGAVEIVHVPVLDPCDPVGKARGHHCAMLCFLERDDLACRQQIFNLEIDRMVKRLGKWDIEHGQASSCVSRNRPDVIVRTQAQSARECSPRDIRPTRVPIEEDLSMATAIVITGTQE